MTGLNTAWVFAEKPALTAELIGAAQSLAEETAAVVLGAREQAEDALKLGAARVYWLGEQPEDRLVDDYVLTLEKLVQFHSPDLFLIEGTRRGRAIAGRLAARLNVTTLTDVTAFEQYDEDLAATHLIFGGGAVRVDRTSCGMVLATVNPGTFTASAGEGSSGGDIIEVPYVEPPWQVKLVERKTRPPASVNLGRAKKIVCAGRGLAKQEDLGMVQELANLLGAELACTRPLAEGFDWLPRERYIGISGAQVKPDLYLGVGVSGQVQHQIGMNGSRVVVAINKDTNAPIFQNADYGIPADLYAILPELIQALKG